MTTMSGNNFSKWMSERPEIESLYASVCNLNGAMRVKRVPVELVKEGFIEQAICSKGAKGSLNY